MDRYPSSSRDDAEEGSTLNGNARTDKENIYLLKTKQFRGFVSQKILLLQHVTVLIQSHGLNG
jgi:hypothetical protein